MLIIGCGKIAGGYNMSRDDAIVMTHALAYRRQGGFRLAACVDPDARAREEFMARWDVPDGYSSVEAAFAARSYDVASVCAPTSAHVAVLETLAGSDVAAVFCEKPIGGDSKRARAVLQSLANRGKPVAVNFTRRWDPAIAALAQEIRSGAWGVVRAIVGRYVRGVINNGSHLIDLVHFLTGQRTAVVAAFGARADGVDGDPSVDAVLRLEDGTLVHLVAGDGRDFAQFELELILEKGVLAIEESGFAIRRRPTVKSDIVADTRVIGRGEWTEGRYGEALPRAVDNLRRALVEGAELASSGETALAAIEICEQLHQRTEASA